MICGCMFSGKTEELIRRLNRAIIARQKVEIFKPSVDSRYHKDHVVSHDENSIRSTAVDFANDILLLAGECDVVGIDEAQFFDDAIVEVCNKLANAGKRVVVAGLDMDFEGRPFGPMPYLLAVAEFVTKVHAICAQTGELASFSFRLTEENDKVVLGEKQQYEARSRASFLEGMKEKKKEVKKLYILLILLASVAGAQDIPLGTWRTHFSYNAVTALADAGNRIYAASTGGIFVFDKDDNSLTTIGKLQGLQEEDISAIHYNPGTSQLFVGYGSGNLDIIEGSEIINIDLTTDSQITGSRTINDITTAGGSLFLMTDFGVLRLDQQKLEVTETIREIGEDRGPVQVYQAAFFSDSLFLATSDGVLVTNIVNNVNLADPDGWKRFGPEDNLPESSFQVIVDHNDQIMAGKSGDGLLQLFHSMDQKPRFLRTVHFKV